VSMLSLPAPNFVDKPSALCLSANG
jgi:hypothetical protein